jgi:uncharacterized membrane protein
MKGLITPLFENWFEKIDDTMILYCVVNMFEYFLWCFVVAFIVSGEIFKYI